MIKEELIKEIKTLESETDVAIREGDILKIADADNKYYDTYANVVKYFKSCDNVFHIDEILREWNTLVRTNGRIYPTLIGIDFTKLYEHIT